jgi:hypothetical protein
MHSIEMVFEFDGLVELLGASSNRAWVDAADARQDESGGGVDLHWILQSVTERCTHTHTKKKNNGISS